MDCESAIDRKFSHASFLWHGCNVGYAFIKYWCIKCRKQCATIEDPNGGWGIQAALSLLACSRPRDSRVCESEKARTWKYNGSVSHHPHYLINLRASSLCGNLLCSRYERDNPFGWPALVISRYSNEKLVNQLQQETKLVETLSWIKGFSDVLPTSKQENKAFPSPSPPHNVVPLYELHVETNKHPNSEWREGGWDVDCFVLWSHPIWVQCLNNFCRRLKDVQIYIYDKKSIYKVIHLLLISTRPSLFLTHGEISVILTTEEWQRQDLVAF